MIKNIFLLLSLIMTHSIIGYSQQFDHSPELKRLYEEANKAMAKKDYNNAIVIYHQAIRIQPNNIVLRRDLAYTYYVLGRLEEGIETLKPIFESNAADPESYQLASALENANGNKKHAERLINEGLKKFPESGLLYFAKGNFLSVSESKKDQRKALQNFRDGIQKDPLFPNNYLAAARVLLRENEPVWAIIYSEIYINLDPNSIRTNDAKKLLIQGYQKLFSIQSSSTLPGLRNTESKSTVTFAQAVNDVYVNNFIVAADGLTTENLVMLRTRFILDWFTKYPLTDHSLFEYHNHLIKQGYFDAYNQFLMGAINDSQEFSKWSKNHNKEQVAFAKFFQKNAFRPSLTDPTY